MSSTSMEKLERLKGTLSKIREEGKQVGMRALNGTLTVGGGALAGYAQAKWGEGPAREIHIPGTEIDLLTAGSVTGIVVGVSGLLGEASDGLTSASAGIAAFLLGDHVRSQTLASASAPKK